MSENKVNLPEGKKESALGHVVAVRSIEIVTAEIYTIRDNAARVFMDSVVQIGRRLEEAKQLVPHGEWTDYLDTKLGYKPSTAQNYMRIAREFGDGQIYRRILDLIWETLTVKDAKINFDSQLEKFEEAIPSADDYDLYGVYPAIDACVALSELMHSRLSGETLEHAIEVSKASITTVAMLEMTQAGREMTDEELKENPAVEQEWDIQWEIFRLLADCEERDIELIKGLRADLREAGESNIGINFQQ